MKRYKVNITVDASGNATAYTPRLSGALHAIQYVPDGVAPFDNTVDMTITSEATGESLLTRTNVSAAFNARPRVPVSDAGGTASLYASGGTAVQDKIGLAADRVKIVIAQGGNAKKGAIHVVVE